jgi:hypothetical protein
MRSLASRPWQALSGFAPFFLLVFSVALLGGCGSGNSASSPSSSGGTGGTGGAGGTAGTGPTDAGGPTGPAAGVLRVNIGGLPNGQKALVVVRGANLQRELTASTDVPLPPGDYTVEAVAVVDGNTQQNIGFAPEQDTQQVTLAKGSGATVDVTYKELAPQISAATKVAGTDTAAALSSVTTDANGQSTLTFSKATSETSAWKAGDIVVFGTTQQTPNGLFGKVVSSDGTTVVIEPTSLDSVLQQGVLSYNQSFSAADVLGSTKIDSGTLISPACATLTASLPATKGAATVALKVTGTLCFSPSVTFKAWIDWKFHKHAYFDVGAGVSSNLSVEGAATVGISADYPILSVNLPRFTVWTGPVPWVMFPKLVIKVGASGEVTAGVTAGIGASASAHGGFSYDNGSFSGHKSHSESFTTQWPTPVATAQLKGYGGPELSVLVDDLAGPFFNLEGYLSYDVNFTQQPLWKLHAGFDLNAGLTTNKLIGKSWSANLYNYDKVIAQSTDTPPVGAATRTMAGAGTDTNLALGPNSTVYAAVGNDIRAIDMSSTPPKQLWAYTGSNFMFGVLRAADGNIYATDFYGKVYALTANGTERWTSTAVAGRNLASPSANTLYVSTDTGVASLSTADGSVVWNKTLGGQAWNVAVAKDGTIYAPHDNALTALTPAGVVKWNASWTPQTSGGAAIGPDGTVYTVSDNVPGATTAIAVLAVAPNGQPRWGNVPLTSDASSDPSVGPDGTIYLCGTNPDASAVALDPATGDIKWKLGLGENCNASPTVGADGKLYLLTGDKIQALDAKTGHVIWTNKTLDGGGSPWGSPLFLPGGMAVGANEGGLYVFNTNTSLATSGWPRTGGTDESTGVQQ